MQGGNGQVLLSRSLTMDKDVRKETESQQKKPYVEPTLEKAQKLEDVTRGVPAVVS
jgi:hypothetical protein